MSLRNNAKTIRTIVDRLSDPDEARSLFTRMLAFAAIHTSSDGQAALMAKLKALADDAALACSELINRTYKAEVLGAPKVQPHESFSVIAYTARLRSFLESTSEVFGKALTKTATEKESQAKKADKPRKQADRKVRADASSNSEFTEVLKGHRDRILEAETPFLIGVDPSTGDVPLYQALSDWLIVVHTISGLQEYEVRQPVSDVAKHASARFKKFLFSPEGTADWMRKYLLLMPVADTEGTFDDLRSARIVLNTWLDAPAPNAHTKGQAEAWMQYRNFLEGLPDHKESMYGETFGVRKVFIKPQGTYSIAGMASGQPQIVSDLGAVRGGLISKRVSKEDLIILCGGPGSGKSTLCRILASELAADLGVYPIFVKLRRLKEVADIPQFLEGHLSQQGLADRMTDLRRLSNVVLILDGFDELVMASRARLRLFFNSLREDHTSGLLRGMPIIVSGRDTLFPAGEGLPMGSHVLTLLPFDRARVAHWGKKWRAMHSPGSAGSTFRPESLLSEKKQSKSPALHHLASWPLTLHLVARVHTSGALSVAGESEVRVTKAVLYRSILAETASRQREQTEGQGRLEPKAMRSFLRDLAWQMYEEGRDSMDVGEVQPILKKHFCDLTETELAELSEVAVVNSPEITKGEQTGFEFVHKSFAEFLMAERIAISLERISFKAPDYGSDLETWRMSEDEAAREVAKFTAIRVLTAEVQEMLEPMIGGFRGFESGATFQQSERVSGLHRVIDRLEGISAGLLKGKLLRVVDEPLVQRTSSRSLLEALANLAAGLTTIGSAAAKERRNLAGEKAPAFLVEPFDGAFWRLLSILQAGGALDGRDARRFFSCCTVANLKNKQGLKDISQPIKLAWLSEIEGLSSDLTDAAAVDLADFAYLELSVQLCTVLVSGLLATGNDKENKFRTPAMYLDEWDVHYRFGEGSALATLLMAHGFINESLAHLRPPVLSNKIRHSLYDILRRPERYPLRDLIYSIQETLNHPPASRRSRRLLDQLMYIMAQFPKLIENNENFAELLRRLS